MRFTKTTLSMVAAVAIGCGGGDDTGDGDGGGGADGPPGVNDVEPSLIAGGGVSSGAIGGEVNVYVIDAETEQPIAGATVRVGAADAASPLTGTTDSTGLLVLSDSSLSGPQTISAVASGHAAATWIGANGANVTLPLQPKPLPSVPTATVSGSIDGWSSLPAPSDFDHYTLALVLYSQTGEFGAREDGIEQPMDGDLPANSCVRTSISGSSCSWEMKVRTGKQIHYAVIVSGDSNGSIDNPNDDTFTPIGIAVKTGLDISAGQNITGEVLTMVSAGDTMSVNVTVPSPPASASSAAAIPALDTGEYGQLVFPLPPITPSTTASSMLKATGAFSGAQYNLLGLAVPAIDVSHPFSSSVVRNVNFSGTESLPAWLAPPTGVGASGGTYSFTPTSGASFHAANIFDGSGNALWNVVLLDGSTSFSLPALDPDPLPSGSLELRVGAIEVPGFSPGNFSLADFGDEVARAAEAKSSFTH